MSAGTGNLPNQNMDFVPLATLPAADLDKLVDNIESLADGTGIGDGSIVTANIADANVTGAKMASYKVQRQNHTTNIVETDAKIQSGWKYGTPGVAPLITFVVTFPVAFTNVPLVVAVSGGDTLLATSSLGSGTVANKAMNAYVHTVTTTGCSIRVASNDGTSWAAGNTVYAHWIAIGQ